MAEAMGSDAAADDERLMVALSAAADQLSAPEDEDSALAAIVGAAVDVVPAVEHAAITIIDGGVIASRHPSSQLVAEVDQLQARYGEGPCVTALQTEHVIVVDDLAAEVDRWPRFGPEAVACGVASMLSFQLFTEKTASGSLNLYSSQVNAFTADARVIGGALATQATLALKKTRQSGQLHRAMASRGLIGQAKGILMERFGVDADTAFTLLVRSSQDTNVKLLDVARWLTANAASRRNC